MKGIVRTKKPYVVLFSLIAIIALSGLAFAQTVDPTKGWHPLQQIAKTSTDPTRVDSTGNGIIDISESSQACNASATCMVNQQIDISGSWALIQAMSNNLELKTSGGQDIILNPTGGNVGIETAAPAYKLDVSGDVRWTGTLRGGSVPWARLTSFPVACSVGQYVSGIGSSLTCSTPSGGGDITDVFAGSGLTGGGSTGAVTLNVGAGTGIAVAADTVSLSNPTKACTISGQVIQSFDLGSSSAPTCIAAGGGVSGSGTGYKIVMWGGSGGGQTAIGDSNFNQDAAGNLHSYNLAAKIFYGQGLTNRVPYMFESDVASAPDKIAMWGTDGRIGTSNIQQNSLGSIGIGTMPASGYALSVNGRIIATGFDTSSDIRLKKDIQTITDPLEKVTQLRGVTFKWNDEKEGQEGEQIGVIAQEVEKVLPQVVTTGKDGYKAVDYGRLSSVLIEAIKAQQKEIDDLKTEIQSLKNN